MRESRERVGHREPRSTPLVEAEDRGVFVDHQHSVDPELDWSVDQVVECRLEFGALRVTG